MKVLLLTATGTEPSAQAWEAGLAREGVPYDKLVLGVDRAPLTADSFADTMQDGTPHAKYQGVVVATGGLVYNNGGTWTSALSDYEWSLLSAYTATYGIRQVTASVYPGSAHGLNVPSYSGPADGENMKPTSFGSSVFPEITGSIPIDTGSWGYFTTPLSAFQPGESFNTLMTVSGDRTVMGVFTHADGREELVFTIDSNQYQLQSMLLSHGLVGWLTKGRLLGFHRNYLSMQVDDLFLPNEVWDTASNVTGTKTVRMRPIDMVNTYSWVSARNQRIDFAFNGAGNVEAGGTSDALLRYVKAYKSRFGFINHTYEHLDFDDIDDDPSNGLQPADLATINSQISQNVSWAQANGIPIRANELVTGEHSGVHTNAFFPAAVTGQQLAWVGDDNSRYPAQSRTGSALTVPRYPTNVYYNTSTRAQQLDEYNFLYLPPALGGACVNTAVTTCLSAPVSWKQYVDAEGNMILRHMLTNDPRPHYAHQSNLTGDRVLLSVLDNAISRYRGLIRAPVVQPNLTTAGQEILRSNLWSSERDKVTAYVQGGKITLTSYSLIPLQIPVTGSATIGSIDASGRRSGWITIQPGATVTLNTAA
ncbi:MAG: hypothetical protein HY827_09595 [Actinobacteria bacterium]|nr:hypothetical protein [Actinomycetota bacterium]